MNRKRVSICDSKKGQGIMELIIATVVIFAFVMITLMGNRVLKDFNDDYQNDTSATNESKAVLSNLDSRYPATFDALVPFIYAILLIICVVAGWLSNTNPIVFIFLVIIIIFLMIVGGILSNAWEDFKADDSISDLTPSYPMTDYIMTHYLLFIGIMGFSMLTSILLKNRLDY
jgi:ABC-type multidrug transport system fused ATPase/permease subunit